MEFEVKHSEIKKFLAENNYKNNCHIMSWGTQKGVESFDGFSTKDFVIEYNDTNTVIARVSIDTFNIMNKEQYIKDNYVVEKDLSLQWKKFLFNTRKEAYTKYVKDCCEEQIFKITKIYDEKKYELINELHKEKNEKLKHFKDKMQNISELTCDNEEIL